MQVRRSRMWGATALALGASLLVALPSGDASAASSACGPYAIDQAYVWTGALSNNWGQSGNWEVPSGRPAGSVPGEPNPPDDGTGTFVCIDNPAHKTVSLNPDWDFQVYVEELYLGPGSLIDIDRAALFIQGTAPGDESLTAPASMIRLHAATLGGFGTLRAQGTVEVHSPLNGGGGSSLSSIPPTGNPDDPYSGPRGTLKVDGRLVLPERGVQLIWGYNIEVAGEAVVAGSGDDTAYLAVSHGTSFAIKPTGTLRFTSDGGYYQGPFTSDPSALVNEGQIVKDPPGEGTTIIDAAYTESGSGRIVVNSGTIAFPNGTTFPAVVKPGKSLSTERCAPRSGSQSCTVAVDPNVDPQSIRFRMPAQSAPAGHDVTLLERQPSTPCAVSAPATGAIVFDGDAHAEGLTASTSDPALVTMRIDARCGSSVDTFTVFRDDQQLQSCLGTGAPPAGQAACLDRRGLTGSSHADGANLYIVARATQTSRWRVRKEGRDVYAPTALPTTQPKNTLGKTVKVVAAFGEGSTVWAKGKIKVLKPKGLKKVKIGFDRGHGRHADPGRAITLKLKLTKAQQSYLEGTKKGEAVLTVYAADAFGNVERQKITLKLR